MFSFFECIGTKNENRISSEFACTYLNLLGVSCLGFVVASKSMSRSKWPFGLKHRSEGAR
jgi:hypothetical protein